VGKTAAPGTRVLAVALLAAATLLAFAPVLTSGFIGYDDDIYLTANPHVQRGVDAAGLRFALTSFYAANWHPVTWLSHMLDWSVFGVKPAGHHAASLAIHLAAVLALFVAFERLTGAAGRSAVASALFAVHPLHVETVAWLAERKDLLCAVFWFLAIAAYARWREARGPGRYLAVVGFAALAMMSKPMAVTLPVTLLLVDVWPLGRDLRGAGLVAAVREKAPLFAMSCASAVLTVLAQRSWHSMATVEACPLDQRLGNAAVASVTYLVKMLWPVKLAVFYPHPGATLPAWKIAGAAVILIVLSVSALRLRRTKPYVLFGWLWYIATLVPVIGLIQVGQQGMADRYTYIPLVGIFVALSWGANDLLAARFPRPALTAAAIALAVALGAAARYQAGFWKDGETLFTRALAVTENNDVAHAQLGLLRGRQGRFADADAHFREAVRIHPGNAVAHLDLGRNLVQLGRLDEASVELHVAQRLDPREVSIYTNLGNIAQLQGRLDDAVAQFREALHLDPGNVDAHDRVGTALAQLGRPDEAYAEFAEAVRLDPRRADTQCNWGSALASQSRYREAASHFEEAIRLEPGLARAHFSLAAASFFLDDYPGAWRETRLARAHGFEPPAEFLAMLSSKMPEPR